MNLRELLDLCQDKHVDDWIAMPGSRPATSMLAGLFDPGMSDARTRPLAGHSIGLYEPEPALSLVWPVPDEFDEGQNSVARGFDLPEWAAQDSTQWKSAREGFVVILLSGSPIWQERLWYLDWGSGIGGYAPAIQAAIGDGVERGYRADAEWFTTEWSVGLAGLINYLGGTSKEFWAHDPVSRLVPEPLRAHPVDQQRSQLL